MDINDERYDKTDEITDIEIDNDTTSYDIDADTDEPLRAQSKPRPQGQRRKRPTAESAGRANRSNKTGKKGKLKKKGWSKKKKALLIAGIIIGFLLLVIGAIVAVIFHYINMIDIVTDDGDSYELLSSIEPEDRDKNNSLPDSPKEDIEALEKALKENLLANSKDLVSDDNVLNILLIGCDARSTTGRGRSDSMILMSINKNTKQIIMTSFLRDTWVQIPDGIGPQRLNAAYYFGGPKLLIKTMEANFHIRIDKYARVNFYSFIDAIDAIGGVDIDVTDEELEYLNDYVRHENGLLNRPENTDILASSGKHTLNGVQALAYSRIRYVGTDFARTQRQRTVLEQMLKKAKGMSLTELNDFLEKVLPNITTNLEKGQIFSLILHASEYLNYERIEQSIPNLSSFENMVIDGMMVLGIDFEKYNKELKESIYGK